MSRVVGIIGNRFGVLDRVRRRSAWRSVLEGMGGMAVVDLISVQTLQLFCSRSWSERGEEKSRRPSPEHNTVVVTSQYDGQASVAQWNSDGLIE